MIPVILYWNKIAKQFNPIIFFCNQISLYQNVQTSKSSITNFFSWRSLRAYQRIQVDTVEKKEKDPEKTQHR